MGGPTQGRTDTWGDGNICKHTWGSVARSPLVMGIVEQQVFVPSADKAERNDFFLGDGAAGERGGAVGGQRGDWTSRGVVQPLRRPHGTAMATPWALDRGLGRRRRPSKHNVPRGSVIIGSIAHKICMGRGAKHGPPSAKRENTRQHTAHVFLFSLLLLSFHQFTPAAATARAIPFLGGAGSSLPRGPGAPHIPFASPWSPRPPPPTSACTGRTKPRRGGRR